MQTNTITIIGMNRIGLSIALALQQQSAVNFTIIGHDRNSERLNQAGEVENALDKAERNLLKAAAVGDIVVPAVEQAEIDATLQIIGDALQDHTLVLDLSGLKGAGIKLAQQYITQGHYIGARPILSTAAFATGSEELGQGRPDLFQNSIFCVMPSAYADPKAVETAVNFGRLLGARPYFIDPVEYDNLVQGVETLPGLFAAALFNAVSKSTGWRDMLRFADWPFALSSLPLEQGAENISQLALNDSAATLRWLEAIIEELKVMRRWVYHQDSDALTTFLDGTELARERWLNERSKNDWLQDDTPKVDNVGFGERFMGSLFSKRESKN